MTDREKLIETQEKIDFVYDVLKSMTNGKDIEDIELENLDNSFLDDLGVVFAEVSNISEELEKFMEHDN